MEQVHSPYDPETTPVFYIPRHEEKGSAAVMWVLKAVSCLMALDFMQYWMSAGGPQGLYGLLFSSYSIAQFVFILFVADYLDKHPMRNMLIVTVSINIIGNIIYMSAASSSPPSTTAQVLIFVGRFVAGIGAANVVIGPFYIVSHTHDLAQRASRISVYNLYGFIGRVAGPLLAFLILEYEPIIDHNGFQMNQFTWPPLFTSIDGILVLIMIFILLTPARDPVPPETTQKSLVGGNDLKADLTFLYAVHTLVICVFWAWYSNIIAISGVQFGMAMRYQESMYWHAYVPILVGFLIGTYTFRLLMKMKVRPVYTLIGAAVTMICGFLVMVDNHLIDATQEGRYWIGCMLLTIGFNMESAAIPAIYSTIIDATGNGQLMARMLGILTLFTCAGRSLGPLWTPALLKVEANGPDPECCQYVHGNVSGAAVAALGFLRVLAIQNKYVKGKGERANLINK